MFEEFIARWDLVREGEPVVRPSSDLLPVTWRGSPAMLKIARIEEEVRGGRLMAWWAGEGAARVFEQDGAAILMERANLGRSAEALLSGGMDDGATRLLCECVSRLHSPRAEPPPVSLLPLREWFSALHRARGNYGAFLARAGKAAEEVLASQTEIVALHGDIHHQNVLDFGDRGWLAIDPKGLIGDRAFDYANIFHNPDFETACREFETRLALVSKAAGLDRARLLKWILAWSGLSAAFSIEDRQPAAEAVAIGMMAAERLDR